MNIFGLFWGVVVLVAGLIFLGINFGWWAPTIWDQIWRLWPVLLVILGIRLIIRNSVIVLILSLALLALAVTYGVVGATPLADKPEVQRFFRWQPQVSGEQGTFSQELPAGSGDTLAVDLGGLYNITFEGSNSAETVKVELTGPKEVIESLKFVEKNDELQLTDAVRPNATNWFRFVTDDVKGTVTLPVSLATKLKLSGVSNVNYVNYQGETNVAISGAGNVRFEDSTAIDPIVTVSGTGKVAFDNCRGNAVFTISGAASVTSTSCLLESLEIETSGTGKIDIQSGAITDLSLKASGASSIILPKPTGDVDQDTSGAAKIRFR